MITEKDLKEAIAECEGQRHPNANTCLKLAAYYTIQNQMAGEQPIAGYSYASGTHVEGSKNEFLEIIEGKPTKEVWSLIKDITDTIAIIEPRLYRSMINKAKEIP